MKKPTIFKALLVVLFLKRFSSAIVLSFLFFLIMMSGYAQSAAGPVYKTFTREYNNQLKGDILTIGNNILNRGVKNSSGNFTTDPNTPFNGIGSSDTNGNLNMYYINVDRGTSGIFSSSRATLTVPNNISPAAPCYRVAYAALYWSGIFETNSNDSRRNDINKVKIKVPNTITSDYQNVVGTIIHDIKNVNDGPIDASRNRTQAYACFADITSLLNATNPNGEYTVANVIADEGGSNDPTGLSAGWSIFIVYEDASLPTKAISSFNGFAAIGSNQTPVSTTISGFTTIPTGPVQARFAFAALEGDRNYNGDYLSINNTRITTPTRPLVSRNSNFFNSSINSLAVSFTDRVPNSINTLGFDAGVIDIPSSSGIIKNNDTSATITLGTDLDVYIYYFMAFSVDIIAPKIVLTKGVKDINNNPADNKDVQLGEELRYELKYQNVGNDNAKSYTITDKLPDNTDFNFPSDIMQMDGMTIPTTAAGNQYVTYDSGTKTLTFNVPNNLVTFDPRAPEQTIRFKVRVVNDCAKLTNACSNIIQNTAVSRYIGDLGADPTNPAVYGEQSFSSTAGCSAIPQSTNFLVGLDACKNRKVVLCGTSSIISASGGYASYSWSRNASGTPVIGTSQTLTVTQPGTYYVYNTATPPCRDLQEIVTVEDFDGTKVNPIIAYADNKGSDGTIPICPNNGKPLPKIFLCGTDDSRLIDINISDATRIVWETTSCARPNGLSALCANEDAACEDQWVSAGDDGRFFTVNDAGQYRVKIYINGCFNEFYFDVTKIEQLINVSHKDILCYKAGNITAEKLTGYEYSLTNVGTGATRNYQDSSSFEIWEAGTYVVNYRIKNLSNTCVFKSDQIEIRSLNLSPIVENPNEQPLCYGEKGSITVSASTGFSGYYFDLYEGGNLISPIGPITDRSYTFSELTPGRNYEVEVYTQDNLGNKECATRVNKYINNPASEIKLNAQALVPLTSCSEGKYKIIASGGSGGYSFFVDGSTTAQESSLNDNWDQNAIILLTPTAKEYTILVRDSKLCEQTIVLKVPSNTKPTYTVSSTSGICYGENSSIKVENIVPNGHSMSYSINNGGTFVTNPVFLNLAAGTYNVVVRYGITYTSQNNGQQTIYCTDPAEEIIITGAASAISASAGVGKLAGCTLGDKGGLLRITNVQGGTPEYEYSFDAGASWQTSNEKEVLPGTYNLAVKDKLGCVYHIPYAVTLDDKPADPIIEDNIATVYNCEGTGTATVVVNNPTGSGGTTYTYEYYLKTGNNEPVPNTPITNNVFTNVPSGDHTVIVKYKVETVSSYSNLLQEDFGIGANTTTPGIASAYCFHDLDVVPSTCTNKALTLEDNQYVVTRGLVPNNSAWFPFRDHTTNGTNPQARFLAINIGAAAGANGILYSKVINNVIPNQPVIVEAYVANLFRADFVGGVDPSFSFELVDGLGNVIAQQPPIPPTPNPTGIPPIPTIVRTGTWQLQSVSLNPGANTTLTFNVRSGSTAYSGNDAAIDDIQVYQVPESCGNEKEVPIKIEGNKAFKASLPRFTNVTCNGGTDGTITIAAENFGAAGYQYNVDGGLFQTTTVSPLVLTGFGVGPHTIIVRNDATGTCSYTLTQAITAPAAVTVTASVTTPPTCSTGATITAVGSGGTSPYQYELRQSNGTTVVTAFSSNNGIFTNVAPENYTIFARDANSCVSAIGAVVNFVGPPTLTASLAAASDLCFDAVNQASLVVTVTGGTAPFTYKLNTGSAQNGNTFNNVGAGTHTILVTDSKNCTATISDIVIQPALTLNVSLIRDLTCLLDASIGNPVISGGNGTPYTYTVSHNEGTASTVTSFPYTATQAGTYVFTVTDSKGCPAVSNTITVSAKTTPTLTAVKTDITCNNKNDGTITVTAKDGFTAAYTYAIKLSTALTYTTQTTNQFTGLAGGTYNVKVIDSKGCESAVSNVTIVNPAAVGGTISATPIGCSGTGTIAAVVTVNGSGGVGPYEYSFNGTNNFGSGNTYSTNTAQTVTAYVKDKNGCQFGPLSTVIAAKVLITGINVMFDTGLECPDYEAHIKFQAVGGLSPIRYQIISGPSGFSSAVVSDGEFKKLKPGDYVFRATDKNGCYFDLDYNVKSVPDVVAGGSVLTPIKCFGENGTIQFTVNGVKDRGYDYVIRNAANAIIQSANNVSETITTINVATPLPAGVYTITVTDRKTGCTATYSVTLTQPTAALSITSANGTNVNCNNDNSTITVVAAGGTTNYSYAYAKSPSTVPTSAYGNSAVLTVDTNSGADLVWDVYVKDANDCTAKRTVTVISDAMPSVTAVISDQCTASGSNFTITATGTGGTGTLTYGINGETGAFQAGSTFNVPASATPYTVWVKDGNQCTASATPLTIYPQLTSNAGVTKTLDCSTNPNAVITTTITGGKAPYTYTVQKGTGTPISGGPASASLTFTTSVTNANADTYRFVITDANGCTSVATATVTAITNPTVVATPVQVSCNGGSNGSVTLAGSGGSGGFVYSFSGLPFTSTVTYSGLSAGIAYAYQVRDSKGCVSAPATITLSEPTALVVSASATNFTCSATNVYQSALVTIDEPTTGTAPYTYSFNGGGYTSTRTLPVNDNGTDQTINYSVKDSEGCIQAGTAIIINRLNPPTIATITATPVYCVPASSTTSTVTVTRTVGTGVGTPTYAITAPAAAATSNTTGVFNGLAGGTTYTFKVTDASGCYATQSFTVPARTPIAAIATKLTDVDCFGYNTGSIRYDVSGFSPGTYSYTVNGGTAVTGQTAATFVLSNRFAGPYDVVFTDAVTGCTASTATTITQPAAALSATFTNVNANCIVTTSKVTVTPAGGTSPYTYAYKVDGVAPVAADYVGTTNVGNLDPTTPNWDVWVKDANGCTFKLDVAIISDPTPTVTASATAQCLGVGSYTITANGSGVTGTLVYSINGGSSYQAGNTFIVTTSGSYTIKVKDANGCTADSNVINVAPQLTLNAVLNKNITCNPAPTAATITLTPTGGTGPFTYTASPNTGSFAGNIFTTNTAGNYTFTATDTATGCTYTTTTGIAVTTPVNPHITGVTQTALINCNGDDTAAISIAINNALGQSPFVFNVRRTAPTVFDYGTQTSGLAAGTYTITVTDAKGCTDTFPFVIIEPTPIVVSRSIQPITCNALSGISLGSITINTVSGGSPNYTYHVTGVNGYDKQFTNQTGALAVFDVVDFGFYEIIITDANGCTWSEQNILIASPPDDLDITVTPPPADCSALGSAEVTVGTSPTSPTGIGPYHFAVYSPGLTYTGPTALPWYDEDAVGSKKTTIPNLLPGVTYTFVVHDALTGCYYFETSTTPIPTNSTITVNPITANNITCKGAANGNVTFTMNHTYGVATPVTYQIYNSQSVTAIGAAVSTTIPASGSLVVNNFGTLPFGNYFVLVTETGTAQHAGCSVTSAPFNITESAIDLSVSAISTKKANCNNLGIILVQGKDGTAPYTYQVTTSATPPLATSGSWVSGNTFTRAGSIAGTLYHVYAKDAYGCIKQNTVTVLRDADPTITAPAPICYNNTAFTINIVGNVDPLIVGGASYSVNSSAFQSSPSFTFNAAGTYNLVIKDGNGCTANVDYVVNPKLELSAVLTKPLDCTGSPNALITLSTIGGDTTPTANYTYEYSTTGGAPWAAMASNVLSAATANTYTFRVTDANNATVCQTTKAIVLDPIPTTVFATTQTQVSCNGGSDGSITVNVTAGEGPYTYDLTGTGSNNTGDTTGIYTGLPAGNYTVIVNSGRGCSTPANVIVGSPTPLAATSSITTPLTCGTGNVAQPATVTVVATPGTGTAPYQYSFDGGLNYSSTNTYQSYVGTTFNVYVKDANACIYILTNGVNIPVLNPPTDMDINGTPVYCSPAASQTSTVSITNVISGVGLFSYTITSPLSAIGNYTGASNGIFTGLAPDTYIFEVTDENDCTYQESYTVDPVTPIAIVGALVTDISCNAAIGINNNGSAQFTVTGVSALGNYSIVTLPVVPAAQISKVDNLVTLTGLTSGVYTVTVTDLTTGCTEDASVTFTEPAAITFIATASKVFCSQDISQITVSGVAGGTGVYSYAVVAGGASPPAAGAYTNVPTLSVDTNLTNLSWDVYVKDANGCISMQNVVVDNNAPPTISVPAQQCYTGTALTVDLSTLTNTYNGVKSYTVNGSAIATSTATLAGPGTYILGIKDDNGCEAFVNYTIENQLTALASLTKELYCDVPVNATIDVTIAGGIAPYSYQMYVGGVATGSSTAVTGSAFTASVGASGTYSFVITDSNTPACSVTTTNVIVITPSIPMAIFAQTNVSCNGGSDGTITITASNGVEPYQYSIDNGVTFQASDYFTGLTDAGVYNIVVKDAKECSSTAILVDITQPATLNASASVKPFGCSTTNAPEDAVVTILPTGGTAPYSYSFDGGTTFQAAASFSVNAAQTINYEVRDVNGCSFDGTAIVFPYTPPTEMDITSSPIYCNTPGTVATLTVNFVTGGVSPYTYEIISPATAATSNLTGSFANLAPNIYIIKVTDSNGCSTTETFEIKEASKITATAQLINDVYCNSGNTGSVSFTVSNYITAGNYTFSLLPATGSFIQNGDVITYTGLTANNYTFTVTDGVSGCVATVVNFTVSEPALALSSTSIATNFNCNNDNATITVTAIGGTADYKYAVARTGDPVPAATSFVASNQLVVDTNNGADVNWTVYVMDSNGCSANNTQAISLDANPTIATAVATQCPSATGTYDITVTASGFSTTLEYSIDGVSFQSGNVITVNTHGTYNVTVKDANGCISAPTAVTILEPLNLTAVVATAPSCLDNDGVVNVTATGGSGSYVYNIDGGAFVATASFANVTFGPHTMGVLDTTTLCEFYVPIDLSRATRVTDFALTHTNVTCFGGDNGTITATMATPAAGINDNPVYMYSLNGGTPQDSNIFTGLTAGLYTVDVISGRGCPATATITVTEPGIIVVPAPTVVQFGCTAGSNATNFATITVASVTGGSGTYANYEFIKNGTRVQFGTSNVYTELNLSGDTYTVNVYDDKGCVGTTTTAITINPFIALDKINVVVNNAITCNDPEDITVSAVDALGATIAGIEYTVKDIVGSVYGGVYTRNNTDGIFTGLTIGNYLITATNRDTGCSIQKIHYVNNPNSFSLQAVKTSDVICFGRTDGTVELTLIDQITPPDNAGAFSYIVTGPISSTGTSATAGPLTLTGLTAGLYTVTAMLTNSPFCEVSTTFTISQPTAELALTANQTAITCSPGNNDGTISLTATGGWDGGYQYEVLKDGVLFSTDATQTEYTGLEAGTYSIKVTDSKGCFDVKTVPLVIPTPITVTAVANPTLLQCYGDTTGTVTATNAAGGQGSNYLYTLNYLSLTPIVSSGPQADPVFTGLGAGTYSITVTDGWNCSTESAPVSIAEPTEVVPALVLSKTPTCLTDAELTLSATGGTAPYRYSTDNITYSIATFDPSVVFTNVLPGVYQYYVKDANDCVAFISNEIKVEALETLVLELDVDNAKVNCKGDATGVIVAKAKGGLGNYVYTLFDGANNAITPAPVQSTPGRFDGLVAGFYQVKVTSGDCDAVSVVQEVTEPVTPLTYTAVVTDVTCNGEKNGRLELIATGGTGVIKFAISPRLDQFFDSGTFDNLATGDYQAIIQDELGCFHVYDFTIEQPEIVNAIEVPGATLPEICAGDEDGQFSIEISGGTAPYSVSLGTIDGPYTQGAAGQTVFAFDNLSSGKHIVYYKDSLGCNAEFEIELEAAAVLNPTVEVTYYCVDNASANLVTVTVDASNDPADVTYDLDGLGTFGPSNIFTNLAAGPHFITVRHKNGCTEMVNIFNVDAVAPLTLLISEGQLNQIVATATGGSGDYEYSFNFESFSSNSTYAYYKTDTYTVTVRDTNGCTATATRQFEYVDVCIPNYFTPNGDGNQDTWGPGCSINYTDLVYTIFDRYGREIAKYRFGQKWDGTYKGAELPTGDYWYVLKLNNPKDDREFVGHFTLYR